MLESDDSGIESADSTADSASNPLRISLWVWALRIEIGDRTQREYNTLHWHTGLVIYKMYQPHQICTCDFNAGLVKDRCMVPCTIYDV